VSAERAEVEVIALGVVTPVGLDAAGAAAAIRAGICRYQEAPFFDDDGEPRVMSFVPEEYLSPLADALRERPMGERHTRLLRLATLALQHATWPCEAPPPLFLALPEVRGESADPVGPDFVAHLALQTGVEIGPGECRLYRQGGAGGLCALAGAVELLRSGKAPLAIVGGIDSFWDPELLASLGEEGRLQRDGPSDALIPGEGAAFLLLGAPGQARRLATAPLARVAEVGLAVEAGHRYSAEPLRGDGPTAAFQKVFGALRGLPPVRCVYAGLNGESLPAKEWSVAYLRSSERFAEEHELQHAADCIGDAGAALGPIQLALAATGLSMGHHQAPCLVWSTSDRDARGAAVLLSNS
jgi:3-oxoacyl-[acyl-carrier-protein] synthase I